MPQNASKIVARWTWVQLTDADSTAITFINTGGSTMLVKATTDGTAPTSIDGSIPYGPGQGEKAPVTIAELFPGITGADRLWAWGRDDTTTAMVSHA